MNSPIDALTEEVVFPLVRRRFPPPPVAPAPVRRAMDADLEDEDEVRPVSRRRVLFVKAVGVFLLALVIAFCVLAFMR